MAQWPRATARAVTATLLAAVAGAAYLGLFALVQVLIGPATAWISALLAATVLGATFGFLEPLRRRVEPLLDATLSADRVRTRQRIHRAVRDIAGVRDETGVVALLRAALHDGMGIDAVHLVAGPPDGPLDEIAPLGGSAAMVAPGGALDVALRAGVPSAREIAGALVIAFPAQAQLVGGVLVGPRADGRPHTRDDRVLLETLAAQVAMAIANARTWEEIRALERRAREENAYLRAAALPAADAGQLVGQSLAWRSALAQVQQVAPTDAAVLVLGETGTGKELVVRAIHQNSRRADRVLMQVASAAVPESLLESELFGHEKGAFSGATSRKLGRFELADGGTLFLDDVDTLPLGIQAKLLRAIQEGEVQRLGSTQMRVVDVRMVAASNRDLLAEVRAGRFREDLYYRLHVVPIHLPPLRERCEDIPLLVEHFARREWARLGRPMGEIPAETLAALQAYDWPGNVRELRNVVERTIVMSKDGVLRLAEPLRARQPVAVAVGSATDLGKASLAELVKRYKTRLIRTALARSDGNQREAAELLGIHRPSLTRMLRELDLGVPAGSSDT